MDVSDFDPNNVNLTSVDPTEVICFLNANGNDYDGRMGARISALFVIMIVSSAATFFPVLAARSRRFRVPLYAYLFARYFGAGVIVATAFIHLLDPAYEEIGPSSCVGMTGGWAQYSWPPAIAMSSVMLIFLLDFVADWYVETKYGVRHGHPELETSITDKHADGPAAPAAAVTTITGHAPHDVEAAAAQHKQEKCAYGSDSGDSEVDAAVTERAFREQIAAFLILEFGVVFHSVIIGLNLGVAGQEFATLYPVLVFHQSFEGLGIGSRLSAIPFPRRHAWMPWALCAAYGLTTPVAIAIGLGLHNSYNPGSFTANLVSGVLDSISAGILMYTGLVEMLARDFIFDPERTRDRKRVIFMLVCLFLGAAIMALLGKWA